LLSQIYNAGRQQCFHFTLEFLPYLERVSERVFASQEYQGEFPLVAQSDRLAILKTMDIIMPGDFHSLALSIFMASRLL